MRNSLLFILFVICSSVSGQPLSFPANLPNYSFINYNSNHFELINNNSSYINLFAKFDSLLKIGENKINIVHIGGSHIQADIYTHRIRQELQAFYPGILGSRGFFFPYKIAQTNSPSNLWIQYTGKWQTCKNTLDEPFLTMGLSGITSELLSDSAVIKIVARYDSTHRYDFNKIKIFCNAQTNLPQIYPAGIVSNVSINKQGNYVQYDFSHHIDTLCIFIRQDTTQSLFQLYGLSLENDDPGVTYNSIGVNGAMLKSYLQCGLFKQQLSALNPDWVIISIGTNEGNTRTFDELSYRTNYKQLLDSIKDAVPNAAILLTVPNDCYFHKKYINYNTARMREIIFETAKSNSCGVWDFYTIMGGLNSVKSWYNNGLMGKDHIHFSKPGYLLKGDLFYYAFLNSWNDFIKQQNINYDIHLSSPLKGIPHSQNAISEKLPSINNIFDKIP